MSQLFPWVRPVDCPEDVTALKAAAAQDNHTPILPTHLAERNGEIVGYAGILVQTALINVWLDSRKVQPRDTLYLLNFAENLAAIGGARRIVMPCAEESPLFPYMMRFGYTNLGVSSINLKG